LQFLIYFLKFLNTLYTTTPPPPPHPFSQRKSKHSE
jgi:hypothetical protein